MGRLVYGQDSYKRMYPFRSHFLRLGEHNLHYIDEGEGKPVLMLHGNPTWSFYYRHLANALKENHRVIVPDHMGCGLSDKPQNYNYTLEQRIQDIEKLVEFLDLKEITLIVHDWGGAIGFGVATRHPELFSKAVILNTAAFHVDRIPFSINICKQPVVGPFIVKNFNAFAWPATFMATKKGLKEEEKQAYLMPYNSPAKRVAISEFVQDIPMKESHPSWDTLATIESKLPELKFEKLILWGGKDFCFNDRFFDKWRTIYPNAKYEYFKNAGHYVLEDAREEVISRIKNFI
jgi:pimeloyl-ACP methyl ester carboxylesterase